MPVSSRLLANLLNHSAMLVGGAMLLISVGENKPSATWTPSCLYASNCSSPKN